MEFGYKTKFLRSSDGGTTFAQVAGLIDVEPHEITRGSVDTTKMDDTSGYKTSKPGPTRDPGEMSIILEWDEADVGQTNLAADLDADENFFYRTEYPSGDTVTMEAHITSWGKAVTLDDRITRTVKFKLSGKPVVA